MQVLKRALTGALVTGITLALLGAGGWRLYVAATSPDGPSRGGQRERSYVVDAGVLERQFHAPVITAYGQVQAWTSLEIRAPATGPVTEISSNVRDGRSVQEGELLFRIDPEIAGRRVTDAKAALVQAEAELAEARQSRKHSEAELEAAKAQAEVHRADLARKQTLHGKKLITSSALDEARLSVSAADQAIVAREQAQLALAGRIEKAEAGVNRARISLSDAERGLADTTYRAPFTGRLADVTLTLGRRVSQNEKLAMLIDPAALEVSFPIRNSDFGNLVDPDKVEKLQPLAIKARLDLAGRDVVVDGVLDRPSAIASVQAGRTVYARLTGEGTGALRPGDFVTVTISEPQLADVAVIPADAATVDGRILLIGADSRLVDHAARILRREADTLVVADVPFGTRYVRRRLPYLAGGIKVTPRGSAAPEATRPVATTPAQANASETAEADGITLDDSRRSALRSYVAADTSLSDERRQKILGELMKSTPSRRLIERLERRIARAEGRS
ncbi:MAG: HlyD family efflux transporter periplasmic adaptor subunit [Hyphomicrobiaceae bacterium]|nr:HlyD family efflux transporter periplasmic adaptor subunit [Hyphomicrobiaceae bacterium]